MRSRIVLLLVVLALLMIPVQSAFATPPSPWNLGDRTPRIAVVSAFNTELQLLLDQCQNKKPYVIGGRTFTTCKLAGHDAVLVLIGGSIYNSALTTQQLFDHFNITKLIFSGIAGGIDNNLNIGDVVIGTESREYMEAVAARENADGTLASYPWVTPVGPPFEFFIPQANFVTSANGMPDEEKSVTWFPGDPDLIKLAEQVAKYTKLEGCGVDRDGNPVCLANAPKIVSGRLLNGPLYMDNARFRSYLYSTYNAQALAMEEVYHACYVNAEPCLQLRSLSDLAGGGPGENEIDTFFQIAAKNSALLVYNIVEALPK